MNGSSNTPAEAEFLAIILGSLGNLVSTSDCHHMLTLIGDWFIRLRGPIKPEGDLVWHYTNGDALLSMIKSGSIYATQAACLNDSTELIYAARLYRKAAETKLASKTLREDAAKLLTLHLNGLVDSPEQRGNLSHPCFVTCFSELRDDLSQWRSYAGGENGFALGFPRRCLNGPAGPEGAWSASVNYDARLHEALAEEAVNATTELFIMLKDKVPLSEQSRFQDLFLTTWSVLLDSFAPLLKDPGFEVERETRLIKQYLETDLDLVVVRAKQTMLSRHLELKFSSISADGKARLPVEHIIVGPGRHKAQSEIGLNLWLKKHGYTGVTTSVSERPYQQT